VAKRRKKTEAAEEAAPVVEVKAEVKAEVKPPESHQVADGKALTSRRGILGPGARIEASDLTGGKEAFEGFLNSGHIVPVK